MKIFIVIFLVFISSCQSNTCEQFSTGKAVLVAYRIATSSHLWLEDAITHKIYDIQGLGGRREPLIELGDTVNVQFCNGRVYFDGYNYVEYPKNSETRFICLPGYEYIYK